MSQKKRKLSKKRGSACVNHPNNFETKKCERCHQFFCSECFIEDWHENFLSQFVGQKRDFIKKIYCIPCQKRVVRVRLLAYSGLLVLFVLPFVIWFFFLQ
jgi:hypothetical protein